MASKDKRSCLEILLDIAQIAIAIAVVVLTSWRLFSVEVEGTSVDGKCVLDGSESDDFLSGTRFCLYAIAVGVLSLLVNAVFGCVRGAFKCITLNACAASKFVTLVGDFVQVVWWGLAFALFLRRGRAANDLGYPNRTERDAVIGLAFGGMIAFAADAICAITGFVMT